MNSSEQQMNMAAQETMNTDQQLERKLCQFVEELLEGSVTSIKRLPRWRPAWNVDLKRGDEIIKLHIRGERGGDVSPFPDLRREADILTLIGQQGVPVPLHLWLLRRPAGHRDAERARYP